MDEGFDYQKAKSEVNARKIFEKLSKEEKKSRIEELAQLIEVFKRLDDQFFSNN